MKKGFLIISFLFFTVQQAQALVDMKNANFSKSWIDMEVKSSPLNLKVQRVYNSRNLHNGIFGFGWCSQFETLLEVTHDGQIRITECGGGAHLLYQEEGFKGSSNKVVINKILKRVKKKNSGMDQKALAKLRQELEASRSLRLEFIRKLNLSGTAKKGTKYYLTGRRADFVVLKNNSYIRKLGDGSFQKFNENGYLVGLMNGRGGTVKIERNGKKISKIQDSKGNQLIFKNNSRSHRVREIIGPSGMKAKYSFSGEDLKCATMSNKKKVCYEYDDLHNLVQIKYPDKTTEQLTYNKDKDWVTSFKDRKGCLETYKYGENKKDPLNHYWSDVKKVCNKKVVHKSRYEFKHKVTSSGRRYLHSVNFKKGNQSTKITYNLKSGRPSLVRKNGKKTIYQYNKEGMLNKKITNDGVFVYSYDPKCKKVNTVTEFLYTKVPGKKKRVKKKNLITHFKMNNKCELTVVKNSSGQFAKIKKDSKGRIISISNHAKRNIRIKYEDRWGLPILIHEPSVGAVKFKYDSLGRRKRVGNTTNRILFSIMGVLTETLRMIDMSNTNVDV